MAAARADAALCEVEPCDVEPCDVEPCEVEPCEVELWGRLKRFCRGYGREDAAGSDSDIMVPAGLGGACSEGVAEPLKTSVIDCLGYGKEAAA